MASAVDSAAASELKLLVLVFGWCVKAWTGEDTLPPWLLGDMASGP